MSSEAVWGGRGSTGSGGLQAGAKRARLAGALLGGRASTVVEGKMGCGVG